MLTNDHAPLVPHTAFADPLLTFDLPGLHIGVAEYDEGYCWGRWRSAILKAEAGEWRQERGHALCALWRGAVQQSRT
jgi:hypothetical protein